MKLINKDKIAAELEKRRKSNSKNKLNLPAAFEDNYLLSLLDTLEIKDVDLEKEYKDFVEEDPVYNKLVNGIVGKAIAKHFFELGVNTRKE